MLGPLMSRSKLPRSLPPPLAIAVLALGLLGAPIGAIAQPPVVNVATAVCASGTAGIQVDGTCYPAPPLPPPGGGLTPQGGLQVLVLSRGSLTFVSNQSLTTNVGLQTANCVVQSAIAGPALQKLTSASNLVIVSSVGQPAFVSDPIAVCQAAATLGTALQGLGGSGAPAGAVAYSLIGIPGLGAGNGWELAPPTLSAPASLNGYLAQDVYNHYAFMPRAFVQIITRTTDGSGNPAVQVGPTTLSAPALPAGAQGGYQVVMVDRHTGQAYLNVTYATNQADSNDSTIAQEAMSTTISTVCCDLQPLRPEQHRGRPALQRHPHGLGEAPDRRPARPQWRRRLAVQQHDAR